MRAVKKKLLEIYFFKHDASLHRFLCLFLNMFMFNSLLNNLKAETD